MAASGDETMSAKGTIEARLESLKEEHRVLGIRLEELNGRRHLTQEEEVERNTIRKKKLFLKDQMSSIARNRVPGPPPWASASRVSPPPA